MHDEENAECDCRGRGVHPRRAAIETAQARPFEGAGGNEQCYQECERRPRQEEKRGQKSHEKRRRRGDPRSKRALQAAPASLVAPRFPIVAAATCSLVRPKRRSRLA